MYLRVHMRCNTLRCLAHAASHTYTQMHTCTQQYLDMLGLHMHHICTRTCIHAHSDTLICLAHACMTKWSLTDMHTTASTPFAAKASMCETNPGRCFSAQIRHMNGQTIRLKAALVHVQVQARCFPSPDTKHARTNTVFLGHSFGTC
jgi:hypothetical protein